MENSSQLNLLNYWPQTQGLFTRADWVADMVGTVRGRFYLTETVTNSAEHTSRCVRPTWVNGGTTPVGHGGIAQFVNKG